MLRSTVPFLFLLVSCRSFDVQRQQVLLRYQPEVDVLDLVLVYEGVGAEKDIDETTTTLAKIGKGQRHFLVWDWPFDFDLDAMRDKLRRQPVDPEDEWAGAARSFLEYEPSISVTESRFLLDEKGGGRLCLLQRLRFDHATRALRLVDLASNALVLEGVGKNDAKLGEDPRTDALLFERARRGGEWARFDGHELVVSVPMTPERAAVQLKELVTHAVSRTEGDLDVDLFLAALSAVQVTGEELLLRFAPAEDGWIHFTLSDHREYHPEVRERLGRDGAIPVENLADAVQRLKAKP